MSEDLLYFQLKSVKLPLPERQFKFCPDRRFRADFGWAAQKLLVEVQGGAFVNGRHTRGMGFEKDCERKAIAMLLGYRILEVTPRQVKQGKALEWIGRALA